MISFRGMLTKMLYNKPKIVEERVKNKIARVLDITNQTSLSPESCAIIIMITENELERELNATN